MTDVDNAELSKRALEQLRIARERLAHANEERDGLLELVPCIVVRMRAGGYVDYLNPQWTHYTGMTVEDSKGHGWHRAIHPDERPVGVEWWRESIESERPVEPVEPVEIEWRLRRADGEDRWHVFRAVSLRGGPEPVWYGSMTDIHDTRERASDAARIAQFRERMVGVVSHDLRSPLSAIILATELLHLHGLDGTATRTVQRINSCASRALRMISTLLDYTSSHLGDGLPVEPEPQDMTSLVHDIVNESRAKHADRTIQVEAGAAIRAEVDRDRIAQAVANLLGNAVAHGSATEPIVVALSSDADTVTVEVRNRGEVIPPERIARLFEPFHRGDGSGPKRGFGLGLYLVQEIARAHGGRAELTSTAQDGTIARLMLPLLAGPSGPRGDSSGPDSSTPSRGIARL